MTVMACVLSYWARNCVRSSGASSAADIEKLQLATVPSTAPKMSRSQSLC